MKILAQKITYQAFREMEFDDNDDAWYELINGELVKSNHLPLAISSFQEKSGLCLQHILKKHELAKCFLLRWTSF